MTLSRGGRRRGMKLDVSRALKQPGEPFPLDVEQAIAPQMISGEEVRFDPARPERALTRSVAVFHKKARVFLGKPPIYKRIRLWYG